MSKLKGGPMELSIQLPGLFGRLKKPVDAQLIKFNPFHIVINSPTKLKAGQMVYLNMLAGLHCIREVSARVESCSQSGHLYQCQMRFVLERPDKQPYREAISILKSIEKTLPDGFKAPVHSTNIKI